MLKFPFRTKRHERLSDIILHSQLVYYRLLSKHNFQTVLNIGSRVNNEVNLEQLKHECNRAGRPRYQLTDEQGAYMASNLTHRLLFLILWIFYDLRRNKSIYSISVKIEVGV